MSVWRVSPLSSEGLMVTTLFVVVSIVICSLALLGAAVTDEL